MSHQASMHLAGLLGALKVVLALAGDPPRAGPGRQLRDGPVRLEL